MSFKTTTLCFFFLAIHSVVLAQTNALNPTGNVGVGTTIPTAQLEIYRTAGASPPLLRLNSSFSGGNTVDLNPFITGVDNGGFELNVGGTRRLVVDRSGNVGIGTSSPTAKLHVLSPGASYAVPLLRIQKNIGTSDFSLSQHGWQLELIKQSDGKALAFGVLDNGVGVIQSKEAGVGYQNLALQPVSGNVGIGTTNPVANLHVRSLATTFATPLLKIERNLGTNDSSASQHGWQLELTKQSDGKSLALGVLDNGVGVIQSKEVNVGYQNLALQPIAGNVGIGTTNPTQKLSVNGTIRAKEVIVETTGWADHVFADNYVLPSLSSVEEAIKRDKHLPGIPSANEVAEHGIGLGEMQAKLLAKIEELTLHQIAQEKRIRALEAENALLSTR